MPKDNSSDDGSPPPSGSLIPGSEFEKAAADVSRAAGKSIVRGLARLVGAGFAGWIAEREARAEAARMAIQTKAEIERNRAVNAERRNQELAEISHEAEKQLLAQRRFERLFVEMAREQANFEAIAARSLLLTKSDPEADNAREIDDDWIFKFARYAQDVSDKQIQELWARILTSAAIQGRPLLSPAALQIMSLMDKQSAIDFEKFCHVHAEFGTYPAHEEAYKHEAQNIGLKNLMELGLIVERSSSRKFSFTDFELILGELKRNRLPYAHPTFELTQRGADIANAVFGTKKMGLSEELQESYFRDIISVQIKKYSISIRPKVGNQLASFWVVLFNQSPSAVIKKVAIPEDQHLSDRIKRLLIWAEDRYVLNVMK